MTRKNVASWDRGMRALAAVAAFAGAALAPWPAALRIGGLGALGVYLLFTALSGTCLGYALMGVSTCAVDRRGPA